MIAHRPHGRFAHVVRDLAGLVKPRYELPGLPLTPSRISDVTGSVTTISDRAAGTATIRSGTPARTRPGSSCRARCPCPPAPWILRTSTTRSERSSIRRLPRVHRAARVAVFPSACRSSACSSSSGPSSRTTPSSPLRRIATSDWQGTRPPRASTVRPRAGPPAHRDERRRVSPGHGVRFAKCGWFTVARTRDHGEYTAS